MKTVSLELSKQLKEAGYPQEGQTFDWVLSRHDEKTWVLDYSKSCGLCSKSYNGNRDDFIASPSADEILEKLPRSIVLKRLGFNDNCNLVCTKMKSGWWVTYESIALGTGVELDPYDTLAEAAAKMWLYLKEKGFIAE